MNDPTDADVLTFHQLSSVFEKVFDAEERGESPLHRPHGVVAFIHEYYHEAVETILLQHRASGVQIDAESLFRNVMERMWVLGYEFRNACFRVNLCQCGSVTDEKLTEWLGEHKHE